MKMLRSPYKKILPIMALIVPLMALSACGGEPSAKESDKSADPAGASSITVGIIGVAADAGLWAAQDEGFFEEEGLEVTLARAGAGASAMAPALSAGDFDIGSGGLDVVITAGSRGFPLLALGHDGVPISHATNIPGDEHGDFGVLTEDETISAPADLKGKTVAVTTIASINTIMVSAWLETNGVSPDDIDFIEVPFPEMGSVLASKEVDAAFIIEPFLTGALQAGAHVVGYPIADTYPERAHAGYFVTTKYAEEHPEELAAFTRAVLRGNEFVMDDAEYYRDIIRRHTEIPEEIVAEMRLPALTAPKEADIMEILAELIVKYDVAPDSLEGSPKDLLFEANN